MNVKHRRYLSEWGWSSVAEQASSSAELPSVFTLMQIIAVWGPRPEWMDSYVREEISLAAGAGCSCWMGG